MQRRHFMALGAFGLAAPLAHAHHGWSSFDQDKPVYLEGQVESVAWRNPHAELKLRVGPGLQLPADLASRTVPAQSAAVDSKRVLGAARVPARRDAVWEIELAPLTRMQAWKVAEIKPGQTVALVGYTFNAEQGAPVVRVEYLFVDGKAYGLRSSPV